MELSDLPLAPKQPTLQDDIGQPHGYDKAPTTKFLALMGLGASWILGIVCVIVGSGAVTKSTTSEATKAYQNKSAIAGPYHDWPGAKVSPAAAEILPLLVSFIVTALMESTGLIHETSLRWALQDKLVFNSNLRLFTFVRQYFCFGAISNILHAVFIVVSYAAASLMFAISPSQNFCNHFSHTLGNEIYNGCGDFVALATPAVCALGIGLLGQAGLATWQMLSVRIPTWSANPLDTAWASVEGGTRARVPGRCMMSVHEAGLDTGPKYPKARQLSIWKAHKEARRIMYFVWTLTVFSFVWFGVTQGTLAYKTKNPTNGQPCSGCNAYLGNNWNLIPDQGKSPTSAAVIVEFSSSFYAGIHTPLHCAELITNLSRDEKTWRQCYSSRPYAPRPNALFRASTSWVAVTLFVLKAVLHWLFGKGMTYAYNWGIFLRPPQLLYLSFGASILTAFTTFLSFQRPNDEQPATFSHVQTLVDLVDEWHLQIFWGDKGAIGEHEVRHAGTSAFPLNTIIRDAMYEGSLLVQESNSEAAVN
ncbi:uncharacterized protein LY89DRAFT_699562 [Mollisia scopiformis]|uniref:Uncharacterized protein n=1 Tax=Mollisia scopiformis TaxID=149040 RepID=A0A194WZK1_MOLSC|nr:uncharacterized protein LY89DRAFT_699562 [Mollisia scopiformis]KUJ13037.1 hypothetical protein LY89DRAFT_699562 [Mollisia scopiformis]